MVQIYNLHLVTPSHKGIDVFRILIVFLDMIFLHRATILFTSTKDKEQRTKPKIGRKLINKVGIVLLNILVEMFDGAPGRTSLNIIYSLIVRVISMVIWNCEISLVFFMGGGVINQNFCNILSIPIKVRLGLKKEGIRLIC